MPMSEKLLDYVIREATLGIRIMSERNQAIHVFNYGTNKKTGEEFVFVMQVVPKSESDRHFKDLGITLVDSLPLDKSGAVEKSQSPQVEKQNEAKS